MQAFGLMHLDSCAIYLCHHQICKLNSDDKSLTYHFIDDGRNLTASLSPYSGEFEISRRIEMTYTPDKKLEPGIYKVKILHKDANVGNCQLKLK